MLRLSPVCQSRPCLGHSIVDFEHRRYAEPPKRWAAPVSPPTGLVRPAPQCILFGNASPAHIYAPTITTADNLPSVLVYFPGGGFENRSMHDYPPNDTWQSRSRSLPSWLGKRLLTLRLRRHHSCRRLEGPGRTLVHALPHLHCARQHQRNRLPARQGLSDAPLVTPASSSFNFVPTGQMTPRGSNSQYHLGQSAVVSGSTLAAANLGSTLASESLLNVARRWASDSNGIELLFDVRNSQTVAVEIEALGAPLEFNDIFTGRTAAQKNKLCSLFDPYIGRDTGYVQVVPLLGTLPPLLGVPAASSPLEGWHFLPEDGSNPPYYQSQKFEGLYEWQLHMLPTHRTTSRRTGSSMNRHPTSSYTSSNAVIKVNVSANIQISSCARPPSRNVVQNMFSVPKLSARQPAMICSASKSAREGAPRFRPAKHPLAPPNVTNTLSVEARAHRGRFVRHILSDADSECDLGPSTDAATKEEWAVVLEHVLESLGKAVDRGGWLTRVRLKRLRRKGVGLSDGEHREPPRPVRSNTMSSIGSVMTQTQTLFNPLSGSLGSLLSDLGASVVFPVDTTDQSLHQIRDLANAHALFRPHAVVAPDASPVVGGTPGQCDVALPGEDSGFELIPANVACVSTDAVLTISGEAADGVDDGASGILYGLTEWDSSHPGLQLETRRWDFRVQRGRLSKTILRAVQDSQVVDIPAPFALARAATPVRFQSEDQLPNLKASNVALDHT
ncbi:unnamed protein product [Mycena citricolor]|uniref:Uncharacterized protein n=1 Tax=Mycena citricolor TaxID=2018698 RepID=A0AAD2HGN4_9AGAR|nr:unnamed protein product [Mycena citricolor]